MNRFYLTTAIDYVNNIPHLGTAYEKIGADTLARFQRMNTVDVHFQMGNDEHSANVKKEADLRNKSPKAYCDDMRKKFEAIWESLEVSYNDFIQTSEPRHHESVKTFLKMMKAEDLYKSHYEGWYCESCETFFTDKDLVDKKCPTHKTEPKWLKEENYFFALSKYQTQLLDYYARHPEFILPEVRRNEVLSLVKSGLQDISISRSSFPWGIPFPDDSSHVVYVWFDALLNYLTAVGYGQKGLEKNFEKWWPADLHIVGKDITRFHCVIWPAMLMSAGLPLPKTVFGHGFIFLKGEKMSKSLGNIVTPLDIVPHYGADALRYYLLRESSFGSDGDFTWDNFIKRYNSDLANDLGNLLNRTLGMATKYVGGKITKPASTELSDEDRHLKKVVIETLPKVQEALDYLKSGDINFHLALSSIWKIISTADKYIDTSAPWKLAKEEKNADIQRVLYNVLDTLRNVAILIAPFIPQTSQKIWGQLGLNKILPWEKQCFKNIAWGKTPDTFVGIGQPIFPRIEPVQKEKTMESNNQNKPQSGVEGKAPTALPVEGAMTGGNPRGTQAPMMIELIDITDFLKTDLRVAEIKHAEKVEGADKLLQLQVDVGGELRQIVAGIALHYKPEELIGKKIVIVANLKPAKIRGVESHGMLLAASNADGLSVLTLDRPVLAAGAKVK